MYGSHAIAVRIAHNVCSSDDVHTMKCIHVRIIIRLGKNGIGYGHVENRTFGRVAAR